MSRRSYGLRAWVLQRLSAVYMGLFLIFLLFHFIVDAPQSYGDWHGWLAGSFISIASALFFLALMIHAWVGVRDVIMDYVNSTASRFILLSSVALVLVACSLWVVRILFEVA